VRTAPYDKCRLIDIQDLGAGAWNQLLALYFANRTSASKDPIDRRRPILEIFVQQKGASVYQKHQKYQKYQKGMVCLQRYTHTMLDDKKRSQSPTSSAKSAVKPPMKKQRLAATSTALTDML
jgi:hypothetical protein